MIFEMTVNDKIINWIVNRAEKYYAEDIALILIYGSYVNGTANAKSDVDCYFIPRTERGYQFAADFIKEYLNVIKSEKTEEIKTHCRNLINTFADFTAWELTEEGQRQEEEAITEEVNKNTDFNFLARLYEEISSTFNKIYYCAETGNYILAFLSAVCLQCELEGVSREQGIVCYDILSSYDHKDLEKLAETTRKAEQDFVRLITDSGEKIKRFSDFEEFEKAKL